MYHQLTSEQRYAIYLGKTEKKTNKEIAQQIGVSDSTISRELKRNLTKNGVYVWMKADILAQSRKHHTPGNRGLDSILIWKIKNLIIDEDWSPKQISGNLLQQGIHVSHETIYKIIRSDDSGELSFHTRHRMQYHRHKKVQHPTKATNIPNRTSIHDRPKEADGTRFGDWEMDTIVGRKNHGAILTLTERKTNILLMERLKHGKNAPEAAKVAIRLLFPYRKQVLSITTDNGSEFADHENITKALKGVPVYFTDSYCAWQKGSIENMNKLIRQYIPKGANFDDYSDKHIMEIQKKINRRPREKLNFSTPKKEFFSRIV